MTELNYIKNEFFNEIRLEEDCSQIDFVVG